MKKTHVCLIALIGILVSLSRPVWSMEPFWSMTDKKEKENPKRNLKRKTPKSEEKSETNPAKKWKASQKIELEVPLELYHTHLLLLKEFQRVSDNCSTREVSTNERREVLMFDLTKCEELLQDGAPLGRLFLQKEARTDPSTHLCDTIQQRNDRRGHGSTL